MPMKTHRWVGGLALGAALVLGACAPPNQGGPSSPSAPPGSQAAENSAAVPSPSADSSGTPVPQESYGY